MPSLDERFWSKVTVDASGCWLWTGKVVKGYGRFAITAKQQPMAHRWAYEDAKGHIPSGKVIDHLCGVPLCVRPDHLEAVSQRENVLRQSNTGTETHCPHGHEYTPENTYTTPTGYRQCRKCKTETMRRYNKAHPGRGRKQS